MAKGINTSANEKNPRVFPINKTRGIHCSVPLISLPPPKKKLVITKKLKKLGGSRLKGLFPIVSMLDLSETFRSYKENSQSDTRDISTSLRVLPR